MCHGGLTELAGQRLDHL
ncbi:hypothetical protein YPPY113_3044, partial [Yersinia pestis PY-113]